MANWIVKNSGSAEFRGPNSCRVEFQLMNTATGEIKRERKTMYVSSHSKAEKNRCIREFRAELEGGANFDSRFVTFEQYSNEWLASRKVNPNVAPRTYDKEAYRVRTLNLHFAKMRIAMIDRRDIKNYQLLLMSGDKVGNAPTISGRPLSGTTAHGIRKTLKQILQEAVYDGIILKNPCDNLEAPPIDTEEKEPLTNKQVARLRALLDASRPKATLVAIRLCLFAGLRRSEVAGLKWSDYDSTAGKISVCRSLDTSTLEFKTPKTKAGKREIPLDSATIAYLDAFKSAQTEKLLALGKSVNDSCICATAGTDYMHPENVTRTVRRFGNANGFPGITPHVLRHTYCTLLFSAGADLKTTQYLMGHDDPATTLRIYTHYCEENGEKAAAAIDALMKSLPTTNIIKLDSPTGRWGISAKAV